MKTITFILAVLISNLCFTQTDGFVDFQLTNLGYISIPTQMEIQSGEYKKKSEAFQKDLSSKFDFEISGNRVVFQQKGLNEFDKSSFSSYARVIIETDIGKYGDYEKLTTNYTFSHEELSELNSELKSQYQQSFNGTGIKLVMWYGVSITKVNGRTALKVSYSRQLKDSPYVLVNIYSFQNNDRIHRLILSYRLSEKTTWEPLYSKILNSFTITNVR